MCFKMGLNEGLGMVDYACLVCCFTKMYPVHYDGRITEESREISSSAWAQVVCTDGCRELCNGMTGGGIDCFEDCECDELCGCVDPAPYLDSPEGPDVPDSPGMKVPMKQFKGMFKGPKLDIGGAAPPVLIPLYKMNAEQRAKAFANLKIKIKNKQDELKGHFETAKRLSSSKSMAEARGSLSAGDGTAADGSAPAPEGEEMERSGIETETKKLEDGQTSSVAKAEGSAPKKEEMQRADGAVETAKEAEVVVTSATVVAPVAGAAAASAVAAAGDKKAPVPWDTGLYDCCSDIPICCYVTFCHECAMGHVMQNARDDSCFMTCCAFIVCESLYMFPCFVCHKRSEFRAALNLDNGGCNDCMAGFFCGWCAICQMARQAKKTNPGKVGVLGM